MRIAVVGSGISGLTSAYVLSKKHEVHLFEADKRLGGHTHTVDVATPEGTLAVDTGFIVHNDWTYPQFLKLMAQLGVKTRDSSMSFSVKCERTGVEYNGTSMNSLFAQRRNLLSPPFIGMVRDILRFNREALAEAERASDGETLGAFIERHGYGARFREHYIMPMTSAVWSSGLRDSLDFPLRAFIEFFRNHGFLSVDKRPVWKVLDGGSRAYIEPITRPFRDRIRLSTPVLGIRRQADGVEVKTGSGREAFDHVVIACHSDQALRLLEDPGLREREVLGALPYSENTTLLHTDESILPKARLAWAAWNYLIPKHDAGEVTVTYNMNILQSLQAPRSYLVSLGLEERIDPAKVLKRIVYHHPVYTVASQAARARRLDICGQNHTSYAGAYWFNGFHEDGVVSALLACGPLGGTL
jgi:predicted NAD/FAD-binding protein